jgi:hypothetical protein
MTVVELLLMCDICIEDRTGIGYCCGCKGTRVDLKCCNWDYTGSDSVGIFVTYVDIRTLFATAGSGVFQKLFCLKN